MSFFLLGKSNDAGAPRVADFTAAVFTSVSDAAQAPQTVARRPPQTARQADWLEDATVNVPASVVISSHTAGTAPPQNLPGFLPLATGSPISLSTHPADGVHPPGTADAEQAEAYDRETASLVALLDQAIAQSASRSVPSVVATQHEASGTSGRVMDARPQFRPYQKYIQRFDFSGLSTPNEYVRDILIHDVRERAVGWSGLAELPLDWHPLSGDFAALIPSDYRLFLCGLPPPNAEVLPSAVWQNLANVMGRAVVGQTLRSYSTTVLRFLAWCDDHDIPLEDRLPAHEFVIYAFLTTFSGFRVKTITGFMTALSTWHALHFRPLVLTERAWDLVKKGLEREQGHKLPPRRALTREDVLDIHDALDHQSSADVAFFAAVLIGWLGQMRSGTVTIPTRSQFSALYHMTKRNVTVHPPCPEFPTWGFMTAFHPYDKVAKEEGRTFTITVVDDDARLNPFVAWRRHLDINGALSADAPAFASLCRPGQSSPLGDERLGYPLTYGHFVQRLSEVDSVKQRGHLTGHSLRIGGASFYLQLGMHPDVVCRLGGWAPGSRAFQSYWRDITRISQHHLAALSPEEDIDGRDTAPDRALRPRTS